MDARHTQQVDIALHHIGIARIDPVVVRRAQIDLHHLRLGAGRLSVEQWHWRKRLYRPSTRGTRRRTATEQLHIHWTRSRSTQTPDPSISAIDGTQLTIAQMQRGHRWKLIGTQLVQMPPGRRLARMQRTHWQRAMPIERIFSIHHHRKRIQQAMQRRQQRPTGFGLRRHSTFSARHRKPHPIRSDHRRRAINRLLLKQMLHRAQIQQHGVVLRLMHQARVHINTRKLEGSDLYSERLCGTCLGHVNIDRPRVELTLSLTPHTTNCVAPPRHLEATQAVAGTETMAVINKTKQTTKPENSANEPRAKKKLSRSEFTVDNTGLPPHGKNPLYPRSRLLRHQ